jgi:hypothetical protein
VKITALPVPRSVSKYAWRKGLPSAKPPAITP